MHLSESQCIQVYPCESQCIPVYLSVSQYIHNRPTVVYSKAMKTNSKQHIQNQEVSTYNLGLIVEKSIESLLHCPLIIMKSGAGSSFSQVYGISHLPGLRRQQGSHPHLFKIANLLKDSRHL